MNEKVTRDETRKYEKMQKEAITMKKILCALLALAMMLCTFAMAETIAPQGPAFNAAEGTYAASFNRDDLKDGILNNAHLLTVDQYAPEAIEKIAVGDELVIEGKTVAISSLEKDEYGNLLINGGDEKEDGYTLSHYVPDPEFDLNEQYPDCWMSIIPNDYHSYTDQGAFTLEMGEHVTFTDQSELDMAAIEAGQKALTATGIEAVTKAIMESDNGIFDEFNTEMVIENGKVVEITRSFNP